MDFLAEEQWVPHHQQVLARLSALASSVEGVRTHSAGIEYTSLMSCFLMHNVSGASALLSLLDASGLEWFPVTFGYGIARSMFEVDVTAHYISRSPEDRAREYILFEHVLNKRAMDACAKHRTSGSDSWREAMEIEWHATWAEREHEIDSKFEEVRARFITPGKNARPFRNWAGKSIRHMAIEVDHEEAYDTFYAELSSFTHADVHLANRFLCLQPDGPFWTQRANRHDVGEVLHDASSFLTCFLRLFGTQFGVWGDAEVDTCWQTEGV